MFREFCRAGLAQEHLTRLQLVIVIGHCLARMVRQRFLKKSPKHVCLLARVCAARHPIQFFRWGWGHYVHHRYHLWRSGELGCADKSARVSLCVFVISVRVAGCVSRYQSNVQYFYAFGCHVGLCVKICKANMILQRELEWSCLLTYGSCCDVPCRRCKTSWCDAHDTSFCWQCENQLSRK